MNEIPALSSKSFPESGFYIMRSKQIYLLAVCQPIGVNGHGPHKHNDWLSFELCLREHPVIIDPGTYCYTGNIEMRRLFRSTEYHNTAVVDGVEQVPIHNSMFGLKNPYGVIHVIDWQCNESFDYLQAEHTGYKRLPNPIVHRRSFHLNKTNEEIFIEDYFYGHGVHSVQFNFHLDTDIKCQVNKNKAFFYKSDIQILRLETTTDDSEFIIKEGWVSKAYNQKEPAHILSLDKTVDTEHHQSIRHSFIMPNKTE